MGEEEALAGDLCVTGGGSALLGSAGGLCGKGFTQDIRLFLCEGNGVPRLLLFRTLPLLADDCKEGDLC